VLQAQGNLPAALTAYKASLAIGERLARADPGNAGWQYDLSVAQGNIGDVLVAQGNRHAAVAAYLASLAIRESLAKADPGNAASQRAVAINNERLGDIYSWIEIPMEARLAFERALSTYEALIARNPSDVPSQLYSVIPRWRLSRLDPKNARRHLETALAILMPLAAANRLDANRLSWIEQMENELSKL
jgi:tetratricopeptide (TPR) repeat protein